MTPISKQGNKNEELIPNKVSLHSTINYNKQVQLQQHYCYKPYRTLNNY